MLTIKIVRLNPEAVLPTQAHADDTGHDLTCWAVEEKQDKVFFFRTGLSLEPPKGYYTEVYPRSSVYKSDFILANSVGIIDAGYRGEVMLAMRYVGAGDPKQAALALVGKKIGQIVLRQRIEAVFVEVKTLETSLRSDKGFGSSGQ